MTKFFYSLSLAVEQLSKSKLLAVVSVSLSQLLFTLHKNFYSRCKHKLFITILFKVFEGPFWHKAKNAKSIALDVVESLVALFFIPLFLIYIFYHYLTYVYTYLKIQIQTNIHYQKPINNTKAGPAVHSNISIKTKNQFIKKQNSGWVKAPNGLVLGSSKNPSLNIQRASHPLYLKHHYSSKSQSKKDLRHNYSLKWVNYFINFIIILFLACSIFYYFYKFNEGLIYLLISFVVSFSISNINFGNIKNPFIKYSIIFLLNVIGFITMMVL